MGIVKRVVVKSVCCRLTIFKYLVTYYNIEMYDQTVSLHVYVSVIIRSQMKDFLKVILKIGENRKTSSLTP